MKEFNVRLNTLDKSITYAGAVGVSDYDAYSVAVTVMHNGEILDLSMIADVALQYAASGGETGTVRLSSDNLFIRDEALVFRVPAGLMTKVGYLTMQIQLFSETGRMTVLNRFMLEVKSVIEGSDADIEDELRPISDEIFAALNRKLDKEEGGTVSGSVNFTGGLFVNDVPVPDELTIAELEELLQ